MNAARGGIIDEEALAEAIREGRVGGAAIDVFAAEPTTASPLFGLPGVVVTPHLGASTNEAQDKAGEQIAEQVVLALAGDFVPFAVNVEAGAVSETVRPFLGISEILGRFIAALSGGLPDDLTFECQGALAGEDVSILTLAVLKGLFAAVTDDPVSYVNARRIAEERGLVLHETQTASSPYRVSVVTVRSSHHSISGTLVGGAPRDRRPGRARRRGATGGRDGRRAQRRPPGQDRPRRHGPRRRRDQHPEHGRRPDRRREHGPHGAGDGPVGSGRGPRRAAPRPGILDVYEVTTV